MKHGGQVRLYSDGPNMNNAMLCVGDEMIPFNKATVVMETGQRTKIVVEAPIDFMTVEALQQDTKINVIGGK